MQSFCGHIYTGGLGEHLISGYLLLVRMRGYFAGSPNIDDQILLGHTEFSSISSAVKASFSYTSLTFVLILK